MGSPEQIENRAKWVAALRSGEYKQTEGVLENETGFCCLGVLCNLAYKEGIVARKVDGEDISYDDREEATPHSVMDWVGLVDKNGSLVLNGAHTCLIDLNDDVNLTFEEIANVIEAEAKQLFY